jgi:hypothetical protein
MVDDADLTGVWEVSHLAVTPLPISESTGQVPRVACKDSATLGLVGKTQVHRQQIALQPTVVHVPCCDCSSDTLQ